MNWLKQLLKKESEVPIPPTKKEIELAIEERFVLHDSEVEQRLLRLELVYKELHDLLLEVNPSTNAKRLSYYGKSVRRRLAKSVK